MSRRLNSRLVGGLAAVLLHCWSLLAAPAADLAALCADRAAVERVYHAHRLGAKPAFSEACPDSLLEQLTRLNLKKEAVLQRVYQVRVTETMVASEVQRIETTTQAPETLAELKQALGNDPARFARSVARPLVVERLLREHFDNDDRLHAPLRRQVETVRRQVLAAPPGVPARLAVLQQDPAHLKELTWQLASRPQEGPSAAGPALAQGQPVPAEQKASAGPYTVEATAQLAQPSSSPPPPRAEPAPLAYFGDLPSQLQEVLRAQLHQPGDVSAVVEMPGCFLLYLLKQRTPQTLTVALLSVPKQGFEQWLAEQKE